MIFYLCVGENYLKSFMRTKFFWLEFVSLENEVFMEFFTRCFKGGFSIWDLKKRRKNDENRMEKTASWVNFGLKLPFVTAFERFVSSKNEHFNITLEPLSVTQYLITSERSSELPLLPWEILLSWNRFISNRSLKKDFTIQTQPTTQLRSANIWNSCQY